MPTIQSKAAAFVASRQMTYQKTGMQLQKRLLCSEHSVFRPKDSPLREKEKCALLASCQKRERLRINTKWESKEKKVNKGPALSVFRMGPDSSRNNTETQKGKRSHKRNEEGQKGARNGNKVLQVGSPFMACKNVFCQPLPCYSMTTTFMFTWAQQPFFFFNFSFTPASAQHRRKKMRHFALKRCVKKRNKDSTCQRGCTKHTPVAWIH